ncbi:hypothetical protein PEX1_097780 [Penicillium expansum]|nr:hypothetical protein PEXP_039200 [Penicillium expansum]KGO65204.1 hypothetical protein PEX1_097780 [Penicillium expansum]
MCTNPVQRFTFLTLDNHILAKCFEFWLSGGVACLSIDSYTWSSLQACHSKYAAFFPHMRSCYYDKPLQSYSLSMCSGLSNSIHISMSCWIIL